MEPHLVHDVTRHHIVVATQQQLLVIVAILKKFYDVNCFLKQHTVIIFLSADKRRVLRSSSMSCSVCIYCRPLGGIIEFTRCFRQHVTWLILPVVICLSQRLSHACLSISVSLRNCEWLIKTVIVSMSVVYYLDIHGNSRANTCVQTRLLRKGCAY